MGIGAAVVCFAAGAILYWAVDVDLPFVDDNTLGGILILAGALAAVIAVLVNTRRSEATGTSVGSGVGITAVGAMMCWAVDVDFPFITDSTFGVILMLAGVVTIAVALWGQMQGSPGRRAADQPSAREPDPWARDEADPWAPSGGPGPRRTVYDARDFDSRGRYADPRFADPRYADPRFDDPRYGDPRYGDPRYGDPRYDDPRNERLYYDDRDRDQR
jgi:hypothetical protein